MCVCVCVYVCVFCVCVCFVCVCLIVSDVETPIIMWPGSELGCWAMEGLLVQHSY